jgi:hypothetical protein
LEVRNGGVVELMAAATALFCFFSSFPHLFFTSLFLFFSVLDREHVIDGGDLVVSAGLWLIAGWFG